LSAVDHLLVGVNDLEAGIAWVEKATGVRAVAGGSHPGVGTRNALLSLGERRYLEIIAPDPAQTDYRFRVDVRELEEPRLVTWAAATRDIDAVSETARAAGFEVSGPEEGSRARPDGTVLRWKTLRLENDLGHAGVEPIPFFIEWAADSKHPSQDSPGGCELLSFRIEHPKSADVAAVLAALGIPVRVEAAASARLSATLRTPMGEASLD
jgi:hypothetical protein